MCEVSRPCMLIMQANKIILQTLLGCWSKFMSLSGLIFTADTRLEVSPNPLFLLLVCLTAGPCLSSTSMHCRCQCCLPASPPLSDDVTDDH